MYQPSIRFHQYLPDALLLEGGVFREGLMLALNLVCLSPCRQPGRQMGSMQPDRSTSMTTAYIMHPYTLSGLPIVPCTSPSPH